MTGAETTTRGAATTTKAAGSPPLRLLLSPSPVGRTRRHSMPCVSPLAPVGTADPPPPERRTTCPSLSLPRRLLSACAFCLLFASCSLRWLVVASPFVASPPPCVARRAAISRSLDAWLHRRRPFRIAVVPSVAVAVALPSCRPSSLVDCCHFHRHCRVNVHPPLLPSRSLCCACHRRPLPSRHPSPPLLVDCIIVHVHCRITVHHRRSVAPTIAVDPVAVALPWRCPCPSPPLLVDCCIAVGSHCNHRANHRCHHRRSVVSSIAVAIVAVTSLSRLQSPSPSHHCRTFHRHRHCVAVASSIASVKSVSPLAAITMALSAAYLAVILSLRRRRRAVCRPGMDMPLRSLRRRSCCT
jgi:hypothetical protein